ncbi:three-Cys-motif partner protein TcmP [Bradyrhizobium sp. WYCCWR 12774]|uniref:Three-Cys-motif partner protein TcmP n=2 Tax=Nitrobacteraceae TaxID=41294 RepID=A0ABS9LQ93_9BRAD|nr:three-Cys-motif partner protein TcmP [Bradyrhizobium zhengyangense]MCG2641379.1 three-Cys-motif partner protein TcmP [Bradyrhizobium zhengyangense]MCG2668993.1 three-Cys-motif partner protein TcmP [Bradyrhizobium zhengyangense]
MPIDHEFGGQHTELKLSIVEGYLKAFTTALRPHFQHLWYVDAFAGTGSRTVRTERRGADLVEMPVEEAIERRRGSAQIALDVQPTFDFLVFIEKNTNYISALNDLVAKNLQRRIVIAEEDANAALKRLISNNSWRDKRAVVFLDPYGMEVEWSTLQALASTQAIDVWFLFPLAGLFRQATRKLTDIDDHKRAALTRMFGSNSWEAELYPDGDPDMFGMLPERRRDLDPKGLERYVQARLSELFGAVLNPLALPIDRSPQMFSLFLCISNRTPEAIGLAKRIGNHLLDPKRHLIVRSSAQ